MRTQRRMLLLLLLGTSVSMLACAKEPKDKKIEFVYLALGASDATGVGASPLSEGYVFLIKRELDKHVPGAVLINLGVPGARIDLIREQVRIATQVNTKASLVTLWAGTNDLVHGDDPKIFQENLRFVLQNVRKSTSKTIVVGNLPDLTQLPRFRSDPSPVVTIARVQAFNRAIEQEARAADASLVNLFAQPVRDDLVVDLDGFHPNDAGHREVARLFLQVILPKLGVK